MVSPTYHSSSAFDLIENKTSSTLDWERRSDSEDGKGHHMAPFNFFKRDFVKHHIFLAQEQSQPYMEGKIEQAITVASTGTLEIV